MPITTGEAGAEIKRGDTLKLSDGKLFPALSNEQAIGAAAEPAAKGEEMICGQDMFWRRKRRSNTGMG